MSTTRNSLWRPLCVVAGILIIAGGLQHPRDGSMELMLANPRWTRAHVMMLIGFIVFLIGLLVYRANPLPARTHKWVRIAIVGTALQAIEAAFHAASVVDHAGLVAGTATPVLSAHVALAVLLYPVFGIAMIGLIVAGVRDRTLGSVWIAWLGILGAAAHGLSAPLVIVLQVSSAGILFPMMMLFALWLAIAALLPVRAHDLVQDTAGAAGPPLARR